MRCARGPLGPTVDLMGGQVLGGGVIVLVAVALWMVYLLPSWHSRYRYDAAERNAVRLNQALRVLAETAEAPAEVRLELSTRTALAQQKLARQVQHEHEQLQLEADRRRLAEARREVRVARVARAASEERRAQVRRRARLIATLVAVASLAVAGWGGFLLATGATALLFGSGLAVTAVSVIALTRMARVAGRAVARPAAVPIVRTTASAQAMQDVVMPDTRATWTPRELPRPLTVSAGSRAAAVLDEVEAREALRQAAVAEAIRDEAARRLPVSFDEARAARVAESPYAGMGVVDDAEIEDHVRRLLQSRAAG